MYMMSSQREMEANNIDEGPPLIVKLHDTHIIARAHMIF
jgi:hypothetical protein